MAAGRVPMHALLMTTSPSATRASANEDDDLLNFLDEESEPQPGGRKTWRVLVVDDEPDVHEATRVALRDLLVEGRLVDLRHAHSAEEAYRVLAQDDDIAVLLLDVVMESEDAGLRLVKRIRDELGNQAVRIVLRTGQPGYAPEIETIRAYDINDYKTKSELTRVRLFTSLTVAVRSYRQIRQLESGRRGLELVIAACTGLSRMRALECFAEGVVTQLCALLEIAPEGLACSVPGPASDAPRIVAALGRYRDLVHHTLDALTDAELRQALRECRGPRRRLSSNGACFYFSGPGMPGLAVYLKGATDFDPLTESLLDAFSANVAVGLENVLLQQRLYGFAYRDQLLSLPNRNRFIQQVAERDARRKMNLALVDLDDFAEINTVLDHRFGDRVLEAVAARLTDCFGPPVILARIASDTFGLLGPAERITCERIERVFADPFEVQDEVIRVSATGSLMRLANASLEGAEVLKDATIALKQAKILNRGRTECFSADLSVRARERIRMLTNLRAAFSAERLFLAYQPQLDLETGRVVGAEALLRWRPEDGRLIPPDRFIPLAEQSGLMIPIGEWVLRTACRQLKRLVQLGHGDFRMAVNVSHTQFREPGFVAMLGRGVEDCAVAPGNLELELTESVAIGHIDATAAKITEIRAMGVSVALDDFGTGYSSLSVLKQLNVDRLKIDRAFVSEIDRSIDSSGIAGLVIGLGRQLSLVTIAEGVEDEDQRCRLRELGCTEGQGYLFSRPLPSEDFEAWMAEHE